jgi:hypothetical protein
VVGVPLLTILGIVVFRSNRAHPLESRGAVLARAWLAQSLPAMQEFTDPRHAQDLEQWLGHNPPPAFARPDKAPNPIIDVSIERNDGQTADVALKIAPTSEGDPVTFIIHQRWVEREGTWYFDPQAGRAPKSKKPAPPRRKKADAAQFKR